MRMRAETVGAFIDAVYAIAVTILALEIPGSLDKDEFGFVAFAGLLFEYAVAFALLFTFWLQHRRINALREEIGRGGLWLTAFILMLVCLVPRATTLVFEFGENVTLDGLEGSLLSTAGWTTAEAVDLFYVGVVICIDIGILLLLRTTRGATSGDELPQLHRTKVATTVLLVLVVCSSFLFPVQNRYFLLLIPLALFFELELSAVALRLRRASGGPLQP
jgi:uncharacterized membrane protein